MPKEEKTEKEWTREELDRLAIMLKEYEMKKEKRRARLEAWIQVVVGIGLLIFCLVMGHPGI